MPNAEDEDADGPRVGPCPLFGDASKGDVLRALNETRESVSRLAEAIEGLASKEELEEVETKQARRSRWIAAAVAVVAVFVILSIVGILVVAGVVRSNQETNRILVECTTPSRPGDPHECYDDGNRRQGEAIGQILAHVDEKIDSALERAGIPRETTSTTTPTGG